MPAQRAKPHTSRKRYAFASDGINAHRSDNKGLDRSYLDTKTWNICLRFGYILLLQQRKPYKRIFYRAQNGYANTVSAVFSSFIGVRRTRNRGVVYDKSNADANYRSKTFLLGGGIRLRGDLLCFDIDQRIFQNTRYSARASYETKDTKKII